MYTQCPQCSRITPIEARQLSEARGSVRCGRCGDVFSALEALADDFPDEGFIPPALLAERPPTLNEADDELAADEDLFLSQPPESLVIEEPVIPPLVGDGEDYTDFDLALDRRGYVEQRSRAGWWAAASLLALLTLAAQFTWFEHERILAHPISRNWLESACERFGCSLPLFTDLKQIELVNRDIRPHPSVESALIINATLRNKAPYPQAYPQIEIRLSDLNGQVVAAREFAAETYLEGDHVLAEGLAPQTLLPLVFEVVDPGNNAVAFEFEFR